jgi:hypothetical protein
MAASSSLPLPPAPRSDVVITPMPANPFAPPHWSVEIEANTIRARLATVPAWMTANRCPTAADGEPTAPLTPIVSSPERHVLWKDEFRAPLHELSELARGNCQAAAFLRFARAPYWMRTGSDELIVGDLRFDRRGLDFSDLRIAAKPVVPLGRSVVAPPRDDHSVGREPRAAPPGLHSPPNAIR